LDNFIIGKREERRGELAKKSIYMLTVFIYAHCFFGRQQLLPHITKQVVIAVVVAEASETYQS
jgi:hypothetical protein